MRIGLVTGEYPPMQGGVGAFTAILARTLAEQGQQVAVFSARDSAEPDPRIRLAHTPGGWGPAALAAIRCWARDERLDVVNLQYQTAAYGMSPWIHALPDRVRSTPVVTTFHDLRYPYLFPKAGPLRDWIVMHLARASGGAIVTNHEDFERLKTLPRVALIPIGSNILTAPTDGADAASARAALGLPPDDFLIGYFGFLNRSKGLHVLLESLDRLRKQGVPATLLLIGGRTGSSDPTNAAYADEIDRMIAERNLTPYVVRSGFVDEAQVAAYLRAADAVALPFLDGASFRRGTLMAAIHHGCAIVTTHPAITVPEFVDGETMLLVEPNSADDLTSGLRRLYDQPALRCELKAGASRLAARFDWNQIARDTVAFFERVIG